MMVGDISLGGQKSGPGVLRVVEHEGDELHEGLFGGVAGRVRLADGRAGVACAAVKQGEDVCAKDDAQDQDDNRAADADVDSAELKAATAALVATILDVGAFTAGRPSHEAIIPSELKAPSHRMRPYVRWLEEIQRLAAPLLQNDGAVSGR